MRCDAQAWELPAETEAIAYRCLLSNLRPTKRSRLTCNGGSVRHVWTRRPILARFADGLFCLPTPAFSEGEWSNSRLDCTLCNGNPLLRLIDCILCLSRLGSCFAEWELRTNPSVLPSCNSFDFNPPFAPHPNGIISIAACRHHCPSCRRDRPGEPLPSANRS